MLLQWGDFTLGCESTRKKLFSEEGEFLTCCAIRSVLSSNSLSCSSERGEGARALRKLLFRQVKQQQQLLKLLYSLGRLVVPAARSPQIGSSHLVFSTVEGACRAERKAYLCISASQRPSIIVLTNQPTAGSLPTLNFHSDVLHNLTCFVGRLFVVKFFMLSFRFDENKPHRGNASTPSELRHVSIH